MKELDLNVKELARFVEGAEVFEGIEGRDIASLCALAQVKQYDPDEIIIKQNDEADCFFIMIEGIAEVYKEQKKGFHFINKLEPKEIFGEMALIDEGPRTATIKARNKVKVAVFSRLAFHQFLAWSADAGLKILRIINRRLYDAEKQASREIILLQDTTIFAMAKLAEGRDPNIGFHLERIREYALLIATKYRDQTDRNLYIDDEFLDMLYKSAPLHDIGKVGIPDNILLKPGRLDDAEWAIMKTHTIIGADTLQKARTKAASEGSFLDMAISIALSHHERWDGLGYPQGLKGEEIPLSARIVKLADVYDSLLNDNVYRKAYSNKEARKIILHDEPKHFDPSLLEVFEDIEEDLIAIKKGFPE